MNEKLKIGDVVQLKSGGPPMTLIEISGEECKCEWFDGKKPMMNYFKASALQKHKAPGPVSLGHKTPWS